MNFQPFHLSTKKKGVGRAGAPGLTPAAVLVKMTSFRAMQGVLDFKGMLKFTGRFILHVSKISTSREIAK